MKFRHAAIPGTTWRPGFEPTPDPTPQLARNLAGEFLPIIRAASVEGTPPPPLKDDLFIAAGCSKGLLRNLSSNALGAWSDFSSHPVCGDHLGRAVASMFPGHRCSVMNYPAACATGLACISMAAMHIRAGHAHWAIAGAVEYAAWPPALASFRNMGVLSEAPCRPFDIARQGFNTGDGGALFLLGSSNDDETGDAPRAVAYVCGWDTCSSAYHLTAAEPDGATLAGSIRRTLMRAGWLPGDVDGICAHATGTAANDLAEARAICAVFGDAQGPPVFSFKGAIGHLLGASAATELALSIEMMRRGWIPGNPGLQQVDPGLPQIAIRENACSKTGAKRLLKLALGFGGPITTMAVEVASAHGPDAQGIQN